MRNSNLLESSPALDDRRAVVRLPVARRPKQLIAENRCFPAFLPSIDESGRLPCAMERRGNTAADTSFLRHFVLGGRRWTLLRFRSQTRSPNMVQHECQTNDSARSHRQLCAVWQRARSLGGLAQDPFGRASRKARARSSPPLPVMVPAMTPTSGSGTLIFFRFWPAYNSKASP